ncbi:hypothetical protein AUC61_14810 [Pseudomonas sp. S25]|uniref:DUF3829 domain-containing protein n=1 Tax=Pseudomonas maioricensis TaxID=1766623 RepID=A0ABS9ZJP1_9PSED|nr:YiiG family protein [Pseudomonas sp. S25]MCI8210806.1 hypothetical protein [Pseudomonas sp. S25]
MNRNMLVGICVAGVIAFSALKPRDVTLRSMVNSWLGLAGSVEHSQASALRPLISCLNFVDVVWRRAYEDYRARDPAAESPDKVLAERYPELFSAGQRTQPGNSARATGRPDQCLLAADQKRRLVEKFPHLEAVYQRYVTSLLRADEFTRRFDFYPVLGARPDSAADKAARDVEFVPMAEAFLRASSELRAQVDDEDRRIRTAQLNLLRQRDHSQMAFLPGLIQQTREEMDALTVAADAQKLTREQLAAAIERLQASWVWDATDPRPGMGNADDDARHNWFRVQTPAEEYLQALRELSDHWHNNADPQRLSDDFALAGKRFDRLIDSYNSAVLMNY